MQGSLKGISVVAWSKQGLEVKISMCTKCVKSHSQKPEPLMMSKLPDLPWQKVATDLFS